MSGTEGGMYEQIKRAIGMAFNAAFDAFCLSLKDSRLPEAVTGAVIESVEEVLLVAHESALDAIEQGFAAADAEVEKN